MLMDACVGRTCLNNAWGGKVGSFAEVNVGMCGLNMRG